MMKDGWISIRMWDCKILIPADKQGTVEKCIRYATGSCPSGETFSFREMGERVKSLIPGWGFRHVRGSTLSNLPTGPVYDTYEIFEV